MKKRVEITTIEQLINFIDSYYSVNLLMVINVTETYLKCVYISFGLDTKESFIQKVRKHYKFCLKVPEEDRPIMLTKEPTKQKDFKISQMFP